MHACMHACHAIELLTLVLADTLSYALCISRAVFQPSFHSQMIAQCTHSLLQAGYVIVFKHYKLMQCDMHCPKQAVSTSRFKLHLMFNNANGHAGS